jgi:hypothetical protein
MRQSSRIPLLGVALALVAAASAAATVGVGMAAADRGAVEAPAPLAFVPTAAGDPVAFVKTVVDAVVADDYRRAWRTLHPVHQLVAPLDTYVRCELEEPIPGRLHSISVLRVADTRLAVAGVGPAVASKALRMRITIEDMATKEHAVVTTTFHAVPVAGRWRWVLPEKRYALYRTGACMRDGAAAEPAV